MTTREMIKYILPGVGITFQIVPISMISTLLLGLVLGTILFRRVPVLTQIITGYITVMRGIPPLVVLLLLFFNINFSSSFVAAFVALTIYHGAYVTEIVRGGMESVPKGQFQAATGMGVPYATTIIKIVLPQMMVQIIPPLAGQYILLVKDTTLVSVVGVQETLWNARQLMELSFQPIKIYFLVGVFFYLLCLVLELVAVAVEKKIKQNKKIVQRI